jgi:hypothetical protein
LVNYKNVIRYLKGGETDEKEAETKEEDREERMESEKTRSSQKPT